MSTLQEVSNNVNAAKLMLIKSIGCAASPTDLPCESCIAILGMPLLDELLCQEKNYNDDQKQCDKADGYDRLSLLCILHDVIRESIKLLIRHTGKAIEACKFILFLSQRCFEAINTDAIVLW